MRSVVCFILGGGRGTRLYPLTKLRAKPAVPLAGRYRLIDIPVSNSINSGIQKIYVLTQFNSASLNRHIIKTYPFSHLTEGFVEVLAAQQTPESANWFQGTADAVRQYLNIIKSSKADECLILSGDHMYNMDYRPFIQHHRNTEADLTIAVVPVFESGASEFGLLKINQSGEVTEFREKPKGDHLKAMQVDTTILGLDKKTALKKPYIASMGIYVFKKDVLVDLLNRDINQIDFGKEIIPKAIQNMHVHAYLFDGFWEDIGTIEAFYRSNLQLVKHPNPPLRLFDPSARIFTRPRFLPPSRIINSSIRNSLVCEGCLVEKAKILNSIVGIRSKIGRNVDIQNTLLMGCDFYQSPEEQNNDIMQGRPPVGIGENTIIHKAIVDKNAHIGKNVKILNEKGVKEVMNEKNGYWIRDGIVVIIK
ncbi:glucose-1-phosphate adenylyltransferase, partial [candidate division KSB1 bacterium]|nr:glucose-1-phosphate adenylyltransferase [candidate division KSB1 bacterium]